MDAINMRTPLLLSETDADKPIILPSKSGIIWEKLEYFDKKANEYPNDYQWERIRSELLDMWWEQFQKEVNNETTK